MGTAGGRSRRGRPDSPPRRRRLRHPADVAAQGQWSAAAAALSTQPARGVRGPGDWLPLAGLRRRGGGRLNMLWLLSGLVGLGLWLVYDGLLPPRPQPARRPSRVLSGLRDWLVQTGVPISPRVFVLISMAGALLGGKAAQLLLGG